MLRKLTFASALWATLALPLWAQPTVDFRYRPFHWETGIGLPYDWLKTTVNQQAALTYDYAPGPYATPLTEVHLRAAEGGYRLLQVRWSPDIDGAVEAELITGDALNRMNIVVMRHVEDAEATLEATFNPSLRASGSSETSFLRRETWFNHTFNWANPPAGTDPVFRNVAWGPNRAIVYEVAVPAGQERLIALGWADSRYDVAGRRAVLASVEGALTQDVDPVGVAGKNGPVVRQFAARDADGDGWIRIEAAPSPNGLDPNVILNGIWVFPAGTQVADADIINGRARPRAERVIDVGKDPYRRQPGVTDVIYGSFKEPDVAEIYVKTGRELTWDPTRGALLFDGEPMVTSVPKASAHHKVDDGYVITLPAGVEVMAMVHHGENPPHLNAIGDLNRSIEQRNAFWSGFREVHPNPYFVPDLDIQQVIDANWDNLYRMSDRVEGLHIFHTGPSVYRGVWTVDGTMIVQSALFAGDSTHAREYVENIGRFMKPNGQVEIMVPHVLYRETAHYLQQLVMYAEMTGDDAWLMNRWDHVRNGIAYLRTVRDSTLADPAAPYYGLFPPGFADGGIAGGGAEYGSVYYTLVSLQYVLRTARRMGLYDEPEVAEWRRFYADLRSSFVRAMRRDMRVDRHGNRFLPMRVGETDPNVRPPLAQWAFLESVNYAELFGRGDTLAEGTLGVLTSHTEQGLAVGTGWIENALWPWFSMIQGVTHVQMDQPEVAAQLLYDIANHAGPLGTWVEEQAPRHVGERTGGDQSNASGSALYLNLVRRMLVNERSDGLHLLPAAPEHWFQPGDVIRVDQTLTNYGPLTLRCKTSDDGTAITVTWDLKLREGVAAPPIILHTSAMEKAGFAAPGQTGLGVRGEVVLRKQ